jgi:hypothetical protein
VGHVRGRGARLTVAALEPNLQRRAFEREARRNIARDELLDQQRRPLSTRPAPVSALLDEAVLYRQIGGGVNFADPLRKVLDAQQRIERQLSWYLLLPVPTRARKVTLTCWSWGKTLGKTPVVFVESLISNLYHERPAEVARYREAIE